MNLLAEIQAVLDAYVGQYRARDVDGCVDHYAPDGAIFSPYGPAATGRNALQQTHREWFDADETNKKLRAIEVQGSGNLAYCLAAYSGDFPLEDGPRTTHSGTSLNVLIRDPGGHWKIKISSLNSDIPPLAE
ncbi:MAG: nuclear transport factor 2 family protein [Paracoccaceae bacterium]